MQNSEQRARLLFSPQRERERPGLPVLLGSGPGWGQEEAGWLWEGKASAGQTSRDALLTPSALPQRQRLGPESHLRVPGAAHPGVARGHALGRSCTYRLKPGEVWGGRRQRNACSASQRGPRETFASPPGCRRRRWPPRPCCSSCNTCGGGSHLSFERTLPLVHSPHP